MYYSVQVLAQAEHKSCCTFIQDYVRQPSIHLNAPPPLPLLNFLNLKTETMCVLTARNCPSHPHCPTDSSALSLLGSDSSVCVSVSLLWPPSVMCTYLGRVERIGILITWKINKHSYLSLNVSSISIKLHDIIKFKFYLGMCPQLN